MGRPALHMLAPPVLPGVRLPLMLAAIIAALLSGCDQSSSAKHAGPVYGQPPPATTSAAELAFGVVPSQTPVKVVSRYSRLVDLLSENLQQAHLPPLHLRITRDHEDFVAHLKKEQLSFAVASGVTALKAQQFGYRIIAKLKGDEQFRGVLLLPKSSPIKTLSDLRGKRISFPAQDVLSGSMMMRLFLHEHGLDRTRDYQAIYCESSDSAVMTLASGRSDAASLGRGPWQAFASDEPDIASKLEIRWTTESMVQLAIIAASSVPPEAVAIVRQTLLDLDHTPAGRAALTAQRASGYEPANDATFVPARQFQGRYDSAFGSSAPATQRRTTEAATTNAAATDVAK